MNTLEILTAARAKITDPQNWGQGLRRKRINFESCCAAEAIEGVAPHSIERKCAYLALANAAGLDLLGQIWRWNDTLDRTHAEVIAAFDRAIAAVQAQ